MLMLLNWQSNAKAPFLLRSKFITCQSLPHPPAEDLEFYSLFPEDNLGAKVFSDQNSSYSLSYIDGLILTWFIDIAWLAYIYTFDWKKLVRHLTGIMRDPKALRPYLGFKKKKGMAFSVLVYHDNGWWCFPMRQLDIWLLDLPQ